LSILVRNRQILSVCQIHFGSKAARIRNNFFPDPDLATSFASDRIRIHIPQHCARSNLTFFKSWIIWFDMRSLCDDLHLFRKSPCTLSTASVGLLIRLKLKYHDFWKDIYKRIQIKWHFLWFSYIFKLMFSDLESFVDKTGEKDFSCNICGYR
jgi:hypothetical protein